MDAPALPLVEWHLDLETCFVGWLKVNKGRLAYQYSNIEETTEGK